MTTEPRSRHQTRRPGPTVRVRVVEHQGPTDLRHEDRVVTEEPLETRLVEPGRPARRVNVTMRTPGHDFELASGWLLHEGVLRGPADLEQVAYCTEEELSAEQAFNVVTVRLTRPARRAIADRLVPGTSACGVCGTDSIEEVWGSVADEVVPQDRLALSVLRRLPEAMREQQRLFDSTGGLHAAAAFDQSGRLQVLREDVGRHNAVDKVTGARLLGAESPRGLLLCVSGRVGFEIVQKAVSAGYTALVAVGAPTSLAVRLAERGGLALLGWARDDRVVVYAGSDRLVSPGP